jgi:outer membrane receptor for ferrienterochelin and colicins
VSNCIAWALSGPKIPQSNDLCEFEVHGHLLSIPRYFLFRMILTFACVKKEALVFLVGFMAVRLACAQDTDSLATLNLDELVITGQYEPQSVQKSVFRVRTIPLESIQARGAVKLQDVLNTELNIRFSQDLALGGSNITMMGLEGQNVKVLIDGVPMIGRQGTSNEINLNQINVNSIERIEIIEGPMSVVYGSDALAGVINIITKKSNDGKFDASIKVHEESVGNEYGLKKGIHNETLGLGFAKGRFNTRADLSRNYFGGYTGDSTGREKTWHPKTQYLASGLAGFADDRSQLYYRLDYLYEDIFNPGNYGAAGSPPGEALDQNYFTNRFMHQLQGSHSFNGRLSINSALAFTDYQRKTQTTTVQEATGDVRLALGPGLQDLTRFNGITFRGTTQWKVVDGLSIQPGLDLNFESGEGGRIKAGTQSVGDYAVFLSAEWTPAPWIQVRPGLRSIYNTVYDAPPVVPSINTKFRLNDRQDIRLSYGQGFRAPSLRELYFDFIDASHNIEGNTDLKAETSNSLNGSYNIELPVGAGGKVTTALGGFYNDVRNKIAYGQKAGSLTTTYININTYKTKGISWNNTLRRKAWDVSAGLSYTGRYNELYDAMDDGAEFTWSPEVTANAAYRTARHGWTFSAYYKLTGKTPYYEIITENGTQSTHLATISSYNWADASIQKTFPKGLSVSGGVRNIFNITNVGSTALAGGTHTAGSVRPIGSGRSYFVSLAYSFTQ